MATYTNDAWDFHKKLATIIPSLPLTNVVSFEIKVSVGEIPTITINQFLVDVDGNTYVNDAGDDMERTIDTFKIVPIEDES